MTDLNKYINKSQTVRNEGTPLMRQMLTEYREKASEINSDPFITGKGKQRDIARLKSVYERKVIELAKALQDEDSRALNEARKQAEKVLTAELPNPNPTKAKLFKQRAEELEGRILFYTNAKDSTEALKALSELADEPQLAADIKPRIMELSQKVLENANPNEALLLRKELGDVYKDVSNRALPEGAADARNVLEHVEALESSPLFSELVQNSMREISPRVGEYINKPQEYESGNNE